MKVPFLDLSPQHKAIREQALAALAATYDASRFCLGSDVEEFERGFSSQLGYPGALGMNSGTSPLHVACMAAGFKAGDEMIVPPFTFIASAWGPAYVGATPVFADIEPGTFNLDPAALEAAITPRTKGVVVVHLYGQPAPMDEIMAVARKHSLFVIEDCAQAIGARYKGVPVGLIGDAGTFSFYPTKNLGACGEGGALVSRRPDLFATAKQIRVHGMVQRYHHAIIGGNFRMDGFQGAILNVKLPHLPAWTARRRAIAASYRKGIRLEGARMLAEPAYGDSVYHQFTITHSRRNALREYLTAAGVGTDLIYPVPLHLQECFAYLGYKKGAFPMAEEAASTCLSLPIYPELSDAQVDRVVESINAFR
ncbi:MAG TPA: DegT/DnrJ/EryC1/StrS family aminotransferase [Opitutaceae bacterium]|jgi:dTDP-4-amino-4,6-dideoxygalactose transaminase